MRTWEGRVSFAGDGRPCPLSSACQCLVVVGVGVVGAAGVMLYLKRRKYSSVKRRLEEATRQRQQQVRKQKDKYRGESSKVDQTLRNRIVNLSTEKLLKEIAAGHLTALQVLQVYRAEATRADTKTNCLTEYLEEAEELARQLDAKDHKGPLHGLPISVKETYSIKDHDRTSGLAKLLGINCSQDAVIVSTLKKLGAVPFVRTNIVQTTCSIGSSNPIYGETLNPYSPDRGPGGSTAGEGALLALGGSRVGLGTDVGGSVRIPAVMSGIYSFKPTQNRLSPTGIKKSIPGIVGLHDCPGLMSQEASAIIAVFRALVSPTMFQADSLVIPLPFQEQMFSEKRPLKIGFYDEYGVITPTPGCQRAVHVAKSVLEKMGHQVVPFQIPSVERAFTLSNELLVADGGQTLGSMLEFEPEVSKPLLFAQKGFLKKVIEDITGKWLANKLTPGDAVAEKSAYQLWQLSFEREQYVQLFLESMNRQNIDAILTPGYAIPAMNTDFLVALRATLFTTMLYNMLNFPAGSVPVTRETEDDQRQLENFRSDDELHRNMKKATLGATGMPLGVQIVGKPWHEELVLRLMRDLELGLKHA